MLKGVDIYPESLSGKKKFAAPATTTTNDASKTDVNGNCHTASPMSPSGTGKLASSPNGPRPALHLDLEKRDLNGNFTTKPFHHHHQKVRSSPDLELPSPHAGFTQPGVMDRRDLPSPSSTLSSQAPTPAVDKPHGEEREGGLGTLHFSLEYQPERKAFIVHIKVKYVFRLVFRCVCVFISFWWEIWIKMGSHSLNWLIDLTDWSRKPMAWAQLMNSLWPLTPTSSWPCCQRKSTGWRPESWERLWTLPLMRPSASMGSRWPECRSWPFTSWCLALTGSLVTRSSARPSSPCPESTCQRGVSWWAERSSKGMSR